MSIDTEKNHLKKLTFIHNRKSEIEIEELLQPDKDHLQKI